MRNAWGLLQSVRAFDPVMPRWPGARAPFLVATLSVLLFFELACGPTVRVKTAQDPEANFSDYKTFAMLLPNKPVQTQNTDIDPFVMQRLRQITYLELKKMGYVPAPKASADLVVAVLASRDTRYYTYSTPSYGYDPYFARAGWSQEVSTVEEGIVVIDLVDRVENAVIWRGTGVRTMNRELKDPELKEIVEGILSHYPAHTLGSSESPE